MPLLHLLRPLSPFGPIFGKELRTASRRRRNYLLRIAYLSGLMLFLLWAWATSRPYGAQGVTWRAQQQAEMGYIFFATYSMFSVIAMALLGPVFTSTAIGAERLHKTLHVLLMTPITSWQIVSGKLFSRLLTALTLLGLSLPVVALVRLLGGVEVNQMIGVICLCSVMAMASAAIGLFFSTLINRAYAVILLSYGLMFVLYLFVPMIAGLLTDGRIFMTATGMQVMVAANPVLNVATLLQGRFLPIWWHGTVTHLLFTGILLGSSALILRRQARREGQVAAVDSTPAIPVPPLPAPAESVDLITTDLANDDSPPPQPIEPAPTAVSVTRHTEVGNNPVLWREIRRPLLPTRRQRITGAVAVLALLGLTYFSLASSGDIDDRFTQIWFAFIFQTALLLLACILSATAIAQEKESITWTLLLSSPISGRQIVLGKLLGLLRRLLWPLVLMLAHFAVFTLFGIITASALFAIAWVFITFNTVWIATGLYLSLRLSKVTFAVGISLLLPVVMYLFVVLLLAILEEVASPMSIDWFGFDWPELAAIYIPYVHLVLAIESLAQANSITVWTPVFGQVSWIDYLIDLAFIGLIHLALAAVILAYTVLRFDTIVGRARQQKHYAP
jgi:ABC-type transport system involved in multi-copper enzyme maturation permease subunit